MGTSGASAASETGGSGTVGGDTDGGEDDSGDTDGGGDDDDGEGYEDFVQDCDDLHPGHPDSADHQGEHAALLSLFPNHHDPAVVHAVADGSWFSARTWSSGAVPGDGARVLIPCGRTLWYDGVSDARIDRIGNEGILHFRTNTDTKLVVDSLLSAPDAVLTIGLGSIPVEPDVRAEVIIHRDNGPIDPEADPELLTKGVVSHGTVRINGQTKANFLRTSSARAGDSALLFSQEPVGWRVGDKLVVAAASNELSSSNRRQMAAYHDEAVRIAGIEPAAEGYRVVLEQSLQYDHVPPATSSGRVLSIPVANYTRNVFIGTEADETAALTDGLSVPIPERGHVMFMHNSDVRVRNAEFFELGRTDKTAFFSDTNVAGRYALHFHRSGVHGGTPALAQGNAVWGSPGWGIVHHDANLDVLSNAVFGAVGSGIVAEAGNETGDWSDNIVIQTTGAVRSFNAQIQGGANQESEAVYQAQIENNSFMQGEAYGMKSRLLVLHDNVAVSANGAGFSFWPHGTAGPSHIGSNATHFAQVEGYDPYYAQDSIYPGRVATRNFTGNEVIASRHGLNTSAAKKDHRTDLDILIEDLLTWNVDQPVMSFYQQNYIIKNSVFIHGVGNAQGFNLGGVDDGSHSSATHIHDATDFKLINNRFEGYDIAAKEPVQFILGNIVVGSPITEQTGPTGLFREGYTADNDTIDVLDNSAAWQDNLANPAGTIEASIDLEASTLRMDEPWSFFSVFVDKSDSLGDERLEMGAPRNKAFRFAEPDSVWEAVTATDGFYQQPDGSLSMVIQIVVGDRLTGSVGMVPVAIELTFLAGDPSELPESAVNLGPLPADLADDGVGTFTVVDARELGG